MIWYNMIWWHDITSHHMTSHHMTWHDMSRYDTIWYDMIFVFIFIFILCLYMFIHYTASAEKRVVSIKWSYSQIPNGMPSWSSVGEKIICVSICMYIYIYIYIYVCMFLYMHILLCDFCWQSLFGGLCSMYLFLAVQCYFISIIYVFVLLVLNLAELGGQGFEASVFHAVHSACICKGKKRVSVTMFGCSSKWL